MGTHLRSMFGEHTNEGTSELLLLYLNCNPSSQLGMAVTAKKMLKKHSFNHQLNSVVTKYSHALLAGHPSSAATVLSWSFLPGHSELLRGNAKTQPGLEGVDVSANSDSKANLNIQIAPTLFPSLCKSQNTTTQIYRKSTFAKKKLCQIDR